MLHVVSMVFFSTELLLAPHVLICFQQSAYGVAEKASLQKSAPKIPDYKYAIRRVCYRRRELTFGVRRVQV